MQTSLRLRNSWGLLPKAGLHAISFFLFFFLNLWGLPLPPGSPDEEPRGIAFCIWQREGNIWKGAQSTVINKGLLAQGKDTFHLERAFPGPQPPLAFLSHPREGRKTKVTA